MVNETWKLIAGLLTEGNFYSNQYVLVMLARKNMADGINIFLLYLLPSLFSSSCSFRNPCHCGEKPQVLLMGLFKITFAASCFDFCTLFWQTIIVFGWGQSFFLSSKIKTWARAARHRTTLSRWLYTIVWMHLNHLWTGHRHIAFSHSQTHYLSVLICQTFGEKYMNLFILRLKCRVSCKSDLLENTNQHGSLVELAPKLAWELTWMGYPLGLRHSGGYRHYLLTGGLLIHPTNSNGPPPCSQMQTWSHDSLLWGRLKVFTLCTRHCCPWNLTSANFTFTPWPLSH